MNIYETNDMYSSLETKEAFEHFDSLLATIGNLQLYRSTVIGEDNQNDVRLVKSYIQDVKSLMADFNMGTSELSYESLSEENISFQLKVADEGLGEMFGKVFGAIGNYLDRFFKNIAFYFSCFDDFIEKVQVSKTKVDALQTKNKTTIYLKDNRFLRYGPGQKLVKDAKEYTSVFKSTMETYQTVLGSFDDYMVKHRFQTPKTMLSYLPVGFDVYGWFRKNFSFYLDFVEMMKSNGDFKTYEIGKNKYMTESPELLGLHTMEFTHFSPTDDYDKYERSYLNKVLSDFHFSLKSDSFKNTGATVELANLSKAELEEMVKDLLKISKVYMEYNSGFNKMFGALNTLTSIRNIVGIIAMPLTSILSYLLSYRYRLFMKTIYIIGDNVGMLYSAAKGNAETAFKIVDTGVSQLNRGN